RAPSSRPCWPRTATVACGSSRSTNPIWPTSTRSSSSSASAPNASSSFAMTSRSKKAKPVTRHSSPCWTVPLAPRATTSLSTPRPTAVTSCPSTSAKIWPHSTSPMAKSTPARPSKKKSLFQRASACGCPSIPSSKTTTSTSSITGWECMAARPRASRNRASKRFNGPLSAAPAPAASPANSHGTGPHAMSKPFVDVAAGLILRSNNELLLAERPGDKPWSGWWELPGGKIEPGETVLEALSRELKEELDIQVTESARWVTHVHEYPKTIVRLSFCKVTGWEGTPTGIEGQRLAWVRTDRPLDVGPLLPATEPPLRWLQLPDRYLITSIGNADNLANFLQRLERALSHGKMLVQFREPQWASRASSTEIKAAFDAVLHACRQAGSPCL